MAKAPKQRAQKSGNGIWGPLILGIVVSLTFWVPHIDSFNISKFVVLGIGVLILSALALPSLKVKSQAKAGSYLLLVFVLVIQIRIKMKSKINLIKLGTKVNFVKQIA